MQMLSMALQSSTRIAPLQSHSDRAATDQTTIARRVGEGWKEQYGEAPCSPPCAHVAIALSLLDCTASMHDRVGSV